MPRAARSSLRKHPDSATTASDDDPSKRSNLRFSRSARLPDQAAYSRVFARSQRSRDRYFTVLYRGSGHRQARLGLAIAKKHCRLAVNRNRLKRIVRESFRQHQRQLAGLDIVVLSKADAVTAGNQQLFDSLAEHWQRCRTQQRRRQER